MQIIDRCGRRWPGFLGASLVALCSPFLAQADITDPIVKHLPVRLPVSKLSAKQPWFTTTKEGTWLGGNGYSLFLQNVSPYRLLTGAALLVGAHHLSQWRQLSWAGNTIGLISAGWHLSEALDSAGLLFRSQNATYVPIDASELNSCLVLLADQSEKGGTVLSFLRNPVSVPPVLRAGQPRFTQALLWLHEEMTKQNIDRLNIELFQYATGPSISLLWRDSEKNKVLLNPDLQLPPEGSKLGWLECHANTDDQALISPLQPELMVQIVETIRRRKDDVELKITLVEPLDILRRQSSASCLLDSGQKLITLETDINNNGSLTRMRIKQLGESSGLSNTLWYVPGLWSDVGKMLMSIAFLGWHNWHHGTPFLGRMSPAD